jgi:hypothetical protein
VKVGAVSAGFLKPIGKVPQSIEGSFDRNGDHRTDVGLCNNNVHFFRFKPSEYSQFTTTARGGIILNETTDSSTGTGDVYAEGRARSYLVGIKSSFEA